MAAINQEAMWKAWQDAGTPGEEHRKLQHLVGTWDVAGRTWMGGPGGPVTESKGVVETRWLLPGRWLIEDLTMQMMGMPFQGFAISGYDNVKKKFVGTWVDSMSTALLTMEGNFDAEGTTLACFGTSNDPATGEHDKLMGYLTHITDADHHVFEIRDYSLRPEGAKTLELEYTRRK